MASIFTYETDIPRVSSPWLQKPEALASGRNIDSNAQAQQNSNSRNGAPHITRLGAEPQDGPVEYKLHLLLRPRRNFTNMSTVTCVSGSQHTLAKFNGPATTRSISESNLKTTTTTTTTTAAPIATTFSSQQSRQHRLEQLTTQLLWRLQQSSPHHASSATNVVLPSFPEALPELQAPPRPAKLLHGLEESQGALYEIGVADDGTFVGLAEDEMQESLNNLRAMAACLGCIVDVQRMVEIGKCEWTDKNINGGNVRSKLREGKLVVAEALVKPYLDGSTIVSDSELDSASVNFSTTSQRPSGSNTPPQLRVSLTGATMSGKSSLLGALSTTTLDNGRGQSRLSMLKHRHEITSGITSSITQELLGYCDSPNGDIEVVNYATENISSWIDMHAAVAGGRLVFASDSAGHPRYRRTTVRGLVGWDPHWALLCVPADDEGDSSGRVGSTPSPSEVLGPAAGDVDLSAAHLDLCLRLGLPLIIAITKFDLASKTGLRLTLAKLLSIIKGAGRQPIVIPNAPGVVEEEHLQTVSELRTTTVRKAITPIANDATKFVPIVMTSAVQGAGLDVLHALLHELPIPKRNTRVTTKTATTTDVNSVFHIEDVYNKILDSNAVVISGHMRQGTISVGDKLLLGPCSTNSDDSEDSDGQRRPTFPKGLPTSRSFPGALKSPGHILARRDMTEQEWRPVNVVSIRNLRLPAGTLHADQVGTVGLQSAESSDINTLAVLKIRKGMVLAKGSPKSTSTIVAGFKREDLGSLAIGSQVVLYIASVRATARILSARTPDRAETALLRSPWPTDALRQNADNAAVEEPTSPTAGKVEGHVLMVTLHFETAKEYVEEGAQVLVMPGGGPGLFGVTERGEKGSAGLEGFVGFVIQVCG